MKKSFLSALLMMFLSCTLPLNADSSKDFCIAKGHGKDKKKSKKEKGVKSLPQVQPVVLPIVPGLKYDVFVDGNTGSLGDGSVQKPFKTIQAAINHVTSKPLEYPQDTYTILIAAGVYRENLIINGNNKRIALVAMSGVTLGTDANVNTITWNIDEGSSKINPELSINVLAFHSAANFTPGVDKGHMGQFHIEGNIQVNAAASFPLTASLSLKSTYVNSKIRFSPKNPTNTLRLFVYHSSVNGLNPDSAQGVQLCIAEDTCFSSELNIDAFGRILTSSISDGMTLLKNSAEQESLNVEPSGMLLSKFQGTLNAPKGTLFCVDSYTNFWFQQNKLESKKAIASDVEKIVISKSQAPKVAK